MYDSVYCRNERLRCKYLYIEYYYLNFIHGPEFGTNVSGRCTVIVQALYILKLVGKSLHKHLHRSMCDIVLKPNLSDPDTCIKPKVDSCGYNYCAYVTTWLDDVITIINYTGNIIMVLNVVQIVDVLQENKFPI